MTIRLSLFARCCQLLFLISFQLAEAAFPDIKIPSGKELGGREENWGELETAIKPLEGFRVTSAAAEAHLAKTRTMFDESKDGDDGWGIIHNMLGNLGGDNDTLLEKLLALGLHPDLENTSKFTWRPSHLCSAHARPKSAKAISLCRPNLSAKNGNNDTPLEAACGSYTDTNPNFPEAERAKIRPAVALVWEEVEKNGFPSIAEMASNKQWFAVQNLLRRRVPLLRLSTEKHQGKTATEWAVHHGESSLAEELRYYLERYPSDLVVALDEEAKLSATRFTTLDTKLEKLANEQMELKLAQDTSSKGQKTLRDEIIKDIGESEKRQDEAAHNITEAIITNRFESTEAEQSKLRQLLEETMESQKQLEEQVHTLKQALEDAHTKAYLYSSYLLLEQSLDNRNSNTAVEVAGSNKSNMAKPAEG